MLARIERLTEFAVEQDREMQRWKESFTRVCDERDALLKDDASITAIMADLAAVQDENTRLAAERDALRELLGNCARMAAPEHVVFSDDEWRVRCEVRDSLLAAIDAVRSKA